MAQLTIYKASAGSGKTFTLTREYLNLLIQNPLVYRNILAVTFTNKAASEMKSRVLGELIKLAKNQSSTYLDLLIHDSSLTENFIREKAATALYHILHDYSRFEIGTIDSFFQRVVRGFAREAGLQSNFQLELDPMLLLDEAIDRLLDSLDNNPKLLDWVSKFTQEQMEQGKTWNIRKNLTELGKNLFNESYSEHAFEVIDIYADKDFMASYRNQLLGIKNAFLNELKQIGQQFLASIHSAGLEVSDFSYGEKGVAGSFVKMANGILPDFAGARFVKAADGIEGWCAKSSKKKNSIEALWMSSLDSLHKKASALESRQLQYNSAEIILENFGSLALLTDIAKELAAINRERNQFLLSDTAKLLQLIIDGNDAPFIYEKMGTRYHHYMLDEFQDTSRMQWNNFKPLINNSLAEGNACLVVGDVKQSIYRWRNGDWQLLSNKLAAEFPEFVKNETLETNRRSTFEVISFNNSFFAKAYQCLAGQLLDKNMDEKLVAMLPEAYSSPCQLVPGETEKGYVEVKFLEAVNTSAFRQIAVEQAISYYEQLIDLGVPAKQIAFLVRTNGEGQAIAGAMLQRKLAGNKHYSYEVVSGEAFSLSSSPVVAFFIGICRLLVDNNNDVNRAFLRCEYYNYLHPELLTEPYIPSDKGDSAIILPGLTAEVLAALRVVPLYECCEKIVSIFDLGKMQGQTPFLEAFFDVLGDFLKGNPADLALFLEWWDEKGSSKNLPAPENLDAATIITIHKSKGLEFGSVIMPFCSWQIINNQRQGLLWCKPLIKPFSDLPLVPVKAGTKLDNTIFAYENANELAMKYLDNLNLLYVAFTRARRHLFIIGYKGLEMKEEGSKGRSGNAGTVSKLLLDVHEMEKGSKYPDYPQVEFADFWDESKSTWSTGVLQPPKHIEEVAPILEAPVWEGIAATNKLRLKFANMEFSPDADSSYLSLPQRDKGKLFHKLFAEIQTADDVDFALNKLILEGFISRTEADGLLSEIKQSLTQPEAARWFSGKGKLLTESAIVLPGGETRRPDRVILLENSTIVVDFKFGLSDDAKYAKQVAEYALLLQQMGYLNVEAWLWFVSINKTVRVL